MTYKERNQEIRRKRKAGKLLREIAKEFDLTKERIRQITKDIAPPKEHKEREIYTCSYCGNKFKRLASHYPKEPKHCFCNDNCKTAFLKENGGFKNAITERSKKVGKFTKDGELLETYRSLREAARQNKGVYNSTISKCVHGEISQSGGYVWKLV